MVDFASNSIELHENPEVMTSQVDELLFEEYRLTEEEGNHVQKSVKKTPENELL